MDSGYCDQRAGNDPIPDGMSICNICRGGEGGHTGQVGDHTTCSQNEHVGEFLYFKLPNLLVQVKSSAIKDVTKYVLNTNVQFTN